MATGIMLCGMNGAGKSTLGKALADRLGFHFIDNEQLFFARNTDSDPYTDPRSYEEVVGLLMREVGQHPDFVFAAVQGGYGEAILPFYTHIILLEVPREIRLERIRRRSYMKFGERMLPGGDLYESEERFFALAAGRPDDHAENWAKTLDRPILRIDGTKPIEENLARIIAFLSA